MKALNYLIGFVVCYLLASFVSWELNPGMWSTWGRVGFLIFLAWGLSWLWFSGVRSKFYEGFKEGRQRRQKEYEKPC
jgi:hypothetical protein